MPCHAIVTASPSLPSACPAPLFEAAERNEENGGDIGREQSRSSAKKQGFRHVLDKKSLPPRDTSLMT